MTQRNRSPEPRPGRESDGGETTVLYVLTAEISKLFVRGQLGFLRDQGFDIHLATRFDGAERATIDEGVVTWDIPFVRDPSPVRDIRALWALFRLIRRLHPQIVHAGTPKAGLLGMIAAKLAGVPVRIYALHGLRYEASRGAKRTVLRLTERLASACATEVLADSVSILRRARADGAVPTRKGLVLRSGSSNGVAIDRFSSLPSRNAARRELGLEGLSPVIGFVGRMTRDKGVDDLVDVHQSLRGRFPHAGLLLVGPKEHSDAISPRTERLIARDRSIIHVPWLDDPRVAYAAIDLLAFPSYREGLPNVVLEAQAAGVSVVGYAASGTVDAVPDHELLVEVGDVDGLRELVARLLENRELRERRVVEAQSWVRAAFDQRALWMEKAKLFRTALCAAR